MNKPENGSNWIGTGSRTIFCVINTIKLDEHIWVHYREYPTGIEHSCYLESFLERFKECPI